VISSASLSSVEDYELEAGDEPYTECALNSQLLNTVITSTITQLTKFNIQGGGKPLLSSPTVKAVLTITGPSSTPPLDYDTLYCDRKPSSHSPTHTGAAI
jgi:hypothetical protein